MQKRERVVSADMRFGRVASTSGVRTHRKKERFSPASELLILLLGNPHTPFVSNLKILPELFAKSLAFIRFDDHNYNNTFSTGIADIGGGVALQYTNRDTVYDLYGLASYIGASGGPLWYVGGDVISFLDANNAYSEIDGFQIVGGVGFGFDTHITQANTKKIDLKGLRKKEIKRTPSSNRVSINVK